MNQWLFDEREVESPYRLSQLDLYNWGPFGGRHTMSVHPEGTAIIGPTGSGKTTLVDALMTLIVAQPRYNLASSGGLESDRSLMSYVRGVSGGGDELSRNSQTARTGKTVTGISATLNGSGQTVRLGAIIWIDSSSSANADRKDLWIFCSNDEFDLDLWLTEHHEGGARRLKQIGRETPGLRIFDARRSYLAQVRKFFAVSDNAFNLLNRAAGLKQLNSVDEIFRDLVLDDHAMFDRALEVARGFDDLTEIHQELLVARNQVATLAPLEALDSNYRAADAALRESEQLVDWVEPWFRRLGLALWAKRQRELQSEILARSESIVAQEADLESLRHQAEAAHAEYLQQGGGSAEQLEENIRQQQRWLTERQEYAADFQKLAVNLGIETSANLDQAAFERVRQRAQEQQVSANPHMEEARLQVDTYRARQILLQEQWSATEKELALVRSRPDSNIPVADYNFRQLLAEALALDPADLPFVAELIEVKTDAHGWRGAIERAIGGHRLRIIVPIEKTDQAIDWVNQRDNRLHVRLLEAQTSDKQATFLSDGFTRKLSFKPHLLLDTAKALLADIDRHCVADTAALKQTPYAMTVQGMLSGRAGQFEKQDQRALSEGWVTGFSNRDLLQSLESSLASSTEQLNTLTSQLKQAESTWREYQQTSLFIERLLDMGFEKLDVESATVELGDMEARLKRLLAPDSLARQSRDRYEAACVKRDDRIRDIRVASEQRAALVSRLEEADQQYREFERRSAVNFDQQDERLAASHMPAITDVSELADSERRLLTQFRQQSQDNLRMKSELSEKIGKQMLSAQQSDRGALADYGSEVVEMPAYLDRLKVLIEEALPEKLDRFLRYLNEASDQGVVQLLAEIDAEVIRIEERIDELNATLRRVDYQDGRLLQLAPMRVKHESLRELERANGRLKSARLTDTDEGETQFAALQYLVQLLREAGENRGQMRAKALLDPRHRLQFSYEVVDRETSETLDRRTSSKGGSGGEKEIIASYILTASLAYALCPDGASVPLFSTVVLDEAFSKSSQAVAGRIVAALKEFGLHALFVTPNKELQLLRRHTRAAVLVHRIGFSSTLTPMTWQEIDQQARKHS